MRNPIENLRNVIDHVIDNFELDLKGIHGASHWARVAINGYILCQYHPEIDYRVTQAFAFLHDSKRTADGKSDIEHGAKAAEWITENRAIINLSDSQVVLLTEACRGHTVEIFSDNITIQACWDADRLDIGRCKPYIDISFLGTSAAKKPEVMAAAMMRSRNSHD